MEVLALKNLGHKLNIDMGKYQKSPTKEDAIKIFNYIINTITLKNVNVEHPIGVICRTVNSILSRLNSPVKVYYGEFLKPNQTTYIAIRLLAVHIYKIRTDNVQDLINETTMKLQQLRQAEQENCDIKDLIRSKDEVLQQLSTNTVEEENLLSNDIRLLNEVEDNQKEMTAKLKDVQNQLDLLNVQVNHVEGQSDVLRSRLDEENEALKKLMAYEKKLWQSQKLNDEISKEEAIPCVEENQGLPTEIIDTVQKLNENFAQLCDVLTDSDNLSEDNFNIQKKLSALQKQNQELKTTKEEEDTSLSLEKCDLANLSSKKETAKNTLDKLKEKCLHLNQRQEMIRAECTEMVSRIIQNMNLVHRYNAEYCNCVEINKNTFGL